MNELTKYVVESVWVPLSYPFRLAIQIATDETFIGRNMITTTSGEIVLLKDVLCYNQKAEGALASTFQKLNFMGRSDVTELLQNLYPLLVPYFISCGTKNPVHHTAYVLEFMVTILAGEKNNEINVKVAMLAVLFHDVALGFSKLPKITEDHIKDKIRKVVNGNATLEELEQYRNDAVMARKEHMKDGSRIAEEILNRYKVEHTNAIDAEEIDKIKKIIEHHDDPKIPVAYNVIRQMFKEDDNCRNWCMKLENEQKKEFESFVSEMGEEYLIGVDDWLLQCHHEADLLWMLTQDGIEADLVRFSPVEMKTPRNMINNNVSLHKQEVELYRNLDNFTKYQFRNGTVYRSNTGYMLFEYLTKILNERHPQ